LRGGAGVDDVGQPGCSERKTGLVGGRGGEPSDLRADVQSEILQDQAMLGKKRSNVVLGRKGGKAGVRGKLKRLLIRAKAGITEMKWVWSKPEGKEKDEPVPGADEDRVN